MIGAIMPRINFFLAALAVLLSLPAAAQRHAELAPCELAGPGNLSVAARCASLEVAENPERPDGRRIELAFAVVPARAAGPNADPVFFLAGGPGQSARDVAPMISAALSKVNRERDLVFLDQRGTGGSNPLHCDPASGAEVDWMEMDFERIVEVVKRCLADWAADVRFYTSNHAADDIVHLSDHLGFDRINLVGGSYGTRLAQVVARRHPQRVRSLVLDGVVPTRLHLGSEHAVKLDAALARLFSRCAQSADCNARFADLDRALADLIRRYRRHTEPIKLPHPRTGRTIDIEFNDQVLAGALRFLAYDPASQSVVPFLIDEAARTGNPERLASQALIVTDQLTGQIAMGLNFAVGCSEDWPGWPGDIDNSGTLLGEAMDELYARVCAEWPVHPLAEDFHQPFDDGHPVLILSGELDPVTPPEYGEEAAAQYANSRHLVGRGLGHIAMTQPCFGSIIAQFIETASLEDLDTECTDHLGPQPFFVDLLGPRP